MHVEITPKPTIQTLDMFLFTNQAYVSKYLFRPSAATVKFPWALAMAILLLCKTCKSSATMHDDYLHGTIQITNYCPEQESSSNTVLILLSADSRMKKEIGETRVQTDRVRRMIGQKVWIQFLGFLPRSFSLIPHPFQPACKIQCQSIFSIGPISLKNKCKPEK